jgi:NADH-quinone oxidoreductase subunit M
MLRACFPLVPEAFHTFAFTLGVLGVISIVYGAFVALGQTDFKRLVAYSSVSHMGYVLLGFAALTEWGMNGAALQMFNHGTSSAACFLVVGVIYDRAHHRDLNGFGGMSQVMPRYWALTTLAFFASLGLPGLGGFVSEFMTLYGAYQSSDPRFRSSC